jgi:hypothetical protein
MDSAGLGSIMGLSTAEALKAIGQAPSGALTTEQALKAIQQQPAPQQPPASFYDRLRESLAGTPLDPTPNPYGVAALEMGASMATGLPGMIAGGLVGAAQAGAGTVANAMGYNPEWANDGAGARTSQAIQQAMTYQPRTSRAEVLADGLAAAGKSYQRTQEAMGDVGYELGGPAGGTAGYMALPTAEALIPLFAARKPPTNGRPLSGELTTNGRPLSGELMPRDAPQGRPPQGNFRPIDPDAPLRLPPPSPESAPALTNSAADIRLALESGQPSAHTVGWQLAENAPPTQRQTFFNVAATRNGIVPEPLARRAAKAGADPVVINLVDNASGQTSRKIDQMLNIQDSIIAGNNTKLRPANVAGRAGLNRVKVLSDIVDIAGEMVGREAKKLTGRVDMRPVAQNLLSKLEGNGVKLGADGTLDFSGSSLVLSPTDQAALQNVYNLIGKRPYMGARQAHQYKKAVTKAAKFGTQLEGMDAEVAGIIKGIRHDINEAISVDNPAYKNANKHYADNIELLNTMSKRLGDNVDFYDDQAAKSASILQRRVMSNAVSSGAIDRELTMATDIARRYLGGKVEGFPTKSLRFKTGLSPDDLADDIDALGKLAAYMEKRFGSPAETSMHGILDSSAQRAADVQTVTGAGSKLMSGEPIAAVKQVLDAGREKLRATDAEQLKALRELNKRKKYNGPLR